MTLPIVGDGEPVTQRQLADFKRYLAALREADQRAIEIKEVADNAALLLARDHQQYRDEKANDLREQINEERLAYVTRPVMEAEIAKLEAELKPIQSYMSGQEGRRAGSANSTALIISMITIAIAVISTLVVIMNTIHFG